MKELKLKPIHRIWSALLAIMLVVSMMPATVWASPESSDASVSQSDEKIIPETYSIKVTSTGSGNVKLDGKTITTATVEKGNYKLTVEPETGWQVKQVTVDKKAVTLDKQNSFSVNVKANVEVNVAFVKYAKVTVNADNDKADVTIGGKAEKQQETEITSAKGKTVPVTIIPKKGFRLVSVMIKEGKTETAAKFSENGYKANLTVTQNTVVTATLEAVKVITVNYDKNGKVKYNEKQIEGSVTVKAGTKVTLSAVANANYRISKVVITDENGKSTEEIFDGNKYSGNTAYKKELTADKNYTVDVTFAPMVYTVAVGKSDHGKVSISVNSKNKDNKAVVNYGETGVVIIVTPETGYRIKNIEGAGNNAMEYLRSSSDGNRIFLNLGAIKSNKQINVTFEKSETVSMSDLSWNKEDVIKSDENSHYYVMKSKDSKIKISTKHYQGIRVTYLNKDNEETLKYDKDHNSLEFITSKRIRKVEVFDGLYWLEVKDGGTPVKMNVIIDMTEPTVNAVPQTVKGNTKGFYSEDANISVTVKDTGDSSDIMSVEYWIVNGKTVSPVKKLYTYTDNGQNEVKGTITVSASDYQGENVQVHVKATDRAGNEKKSLAEIHINSTAPTVKLSFTDKKADRAEDGFYNAKRIGVITVTDRADCFVPSQVKLSLNGKEYTATRIIWDNEHQTGTFELNDESVYNDLTVSYKNKAGMSAEKVTANRFVIDKTAPDGQFVVEKTKWQDLVKTGTFLYYKIGKTPVTVKAESKDEHAKISYLKVAEGQTYSGDELETMKFIDTPYSFNSDEAFNVYARITDRAGNTIYISTGGVKIDMTKTVISLNIADDVKKESGYYGGDVRFNLTVSDPENNGTGTGIKSVKYYIIKNYDIKTTDPETQISKATKKANVTISEDNPYYVSQDIIVPAKDNKSDKVGVVVVAEDKAGNKTVEASEIIAINSTVPTVTVSFKDEIQAVKETEKRDYYNKPKTVIITYNDADFTFSQENAENGIQLTANGEPVKLSSDLISWDNQTATIVLDKDANYSLAVSYTNKADLAAKKPAFKAFTVDQTDPAGELRISGGNIWQSIMRFISFGLYSKETVTVSATASDATSSAKIEYCLSEKPVSLQNEDSFKAEMDALVANKTLKFVPYEGKFTVDPNKQFVVYLRITDDAGNYIYIAQDKGVIVDKDKPVVSFKVNDKKVVEGKIYNADVSVSVIVNDKFGKEAFSGIKEIRYWITANNGKIKSKVTTYSPERFNSSDETVNMTVDSKIFNHSDTEVHVIAVDNAGNVSEETLLKLDIDITPPAISLKFDNNNPNKVIEERGYYPDSRTATIVVTERSNHFDENDVKLAIAALNIESDNVADSYNFVEEDGNIWNHVTGKTADDCKHIAKVTFNGNANYDLSISYTDKAGNANSAIVTSYEKNGSLVETATPFHFTVDMDAPEGSITAADTNNHKMQYAAKEEDMTFAFWSNEKLSFTEAHKDATSPIDSVEYYVDYFEDGKRENGENQKFLSKKELKESVIWNQFAPFSVEAVRDGNRQFVVYLKITDYAGNITYLSTNGLIVDDQMPELESVAPEISVEPKSPKPINGIYKGNVVFEIKVNDPVKNRVFSGLKKVWYEVYDYGSGNNKPTQSPEKPLFAFGDDYTQEKINESRVKSFEVTVDSKKNNSNDVRLIVHAIDNAGNESEQVTSIKIDTTAPEMFVSYDNNNVSNGKYFKSDRTATIVVRERNFDPEGTKLNIANPHGFIPKNAKWVMSKKGTGNGDDTEYRTTIVYNADGDYTFSMDCTDLAGNFTASNKVHYTGVVPTEFTVDKTTPVVSVSYDNKNVKNGKYYNKARTATITINEHNFSGANGIDIRINGAHKSVNWSGNGNAHTARITFADNKEYTFDIDYTDLAGNKAKDYKPDTFVIDTKPPVITIKDVKEGDVFGRDFESKKIEPKVSIEETNFAGKVTVTLTGKRTPAKTATYGNRGFTCDNIENDDVYTFKVNVTDQAGNTSSKEIKDIFVCRQGSVFNIESLGSVNTRHINEALTSDIVINEESVRPLDLDKVKIMVTVGDKTEELFRKPDEPQPSGGNYFEVTKRESNGWNEYTYTLSKDLFASDGNYSIAIESVDEDGNVTKSVEESKQAKINFRVDKKAPHIATNDLNEKRYEEYVTENKKVTIVFRDNLDRTLSEFNDYKIYLNDKLLTLGFNEYDVDMEHREISFNVPESNTKQYVRVVAKDSAGNQSEKSYVFLVSTNIFVRWFNNTPVFIGSIAGLSILLIAIIAFVVFGKKRKV